MMIHERERSNETAFANGSTVPLIAKGRPGRNRRAGLLVRGSGSSTGTMP